MSFEGKTGPYLLYAAVRIKSILRKAEEAGVAPGPITPSHDDEAALVLALDAYPKAMAQAAGILGFKSMNKTPADGSIYYFVGADKLRFKRPCVPGDQVMLRAKILGDRRGVWRFEVSSDVDGELCASATILCADR